MSARVVWTGKLPSGLVGRVVVTPSKPGVFATVATEVERTDALGVSYWSPASMFGDNAVIGVLCAAVLELVKEPVLLPVTPEAKPS